MALFSAARYQSVTSIDTCPAFCSLLSKKKSTCLTWWQYRKRPRLSTSNQISSFHILKILEISKPCGLSPSALSTKKKKQLNYMSRVVCSLLTKTFQNCKLNMRCPRLLQLTTKIYLFCSNFTSSLWTTCLFCSSKIATPEPYVLSLPLFQIKHRIRYVRSFLSADRKQRRLRSCLASGFRAIQCNQEAGIWQKGN